MRAPRSTRMPRPRPGTTPRSTAVLRYEQKRGHDVKSYYVGAQQMGENQAPQSRRGREEGQGLHPTDQGNYGRGEARRRRSGYQTPPAPGGGQSARGQHGQGQRAERDQARRRSARRRDLRRGAL